MAVNRRTVFIRCESDSGDHLRELAKADTCRPEQRQTGVETRMAELSKTKMRVPALDKAVRILDHVAHASSSSSLSQIAQALALPKSTTHTICNTLLELDLLIKQPDQTYRVGPHVMRWSNAFTQQSDVATEFATIWDHETQLPGATITLSVRDGAEVVYIAARNSPLSHSLIEFRAGMRLPAAFTATGKAFLSCMNEFEVRKLYKGGLPAPRTPNSVQDIDVLLAELRTIRENGYSMDNQEVAEGVVCYGAAVLNSLNQPIAGVAVSLPVDQFGQAEADSAIHNVRRIAERLSYRMGAELN